MTQKPPGDNETKRFETEFSLTDASVGDRIAPELIPRSPQIEVGEKVARHIPKHSPPDHEDDRTFSVRLIAHGTDRYNDVQTALVYDPDADLFARLGGHTNSGAWNQKERDYKIRGIGEEISLVDAWDITIPDIDEFDEEPEEFVDTWLQILFNNIRHGDVETNEIDQFNGKKFQLRDYDGRRAHIQYELVSEGED